MLHDGAAAAFRLLDATNEFIAATAPWTLAKNPDNEAHLTQVLFDAAEAIRLAAVMLTPIMPRSAQRDPAPRRIVTERAHARPRRPLESTSGERVLLQEGPLWPRKETALTDNRTPEAQPQPAATSPAITTPPAPAASAVPAPSTDRIGIEDFMKVELRVAKVLAAERVEKSKKLLKLSVDVGTEHRTLVAGIAEAYEPESLVGKSVVIVFNLKPAKLMGIESNGMVLAASPDGGKPEVVTFEQPPAPGTRVR